MGGAYSPMPSEPQRVEQPKGAPPSTVTTAVRLMFVSAGLSVVGLIVLLATKDDLRKAVRKNDPSGTASHIDNLVNVAVTVGIVVGVVLLVLYVLLALQVRKGKNWARIVTWVFAVLGAFGAISSVAQPGSAATKILAAIGGLVDVAVIVLLAQRKSHPYFRNRAY